MAVLEKRTDLLQLGAGKGWSLVSAVPFWLYCVSGPNQKIMSLYITWACYLILTERIYLFKYLKVFKCFKHYDYHDQSI